ncbi:LysR substrate-binding domain-containing protein [Paracoccus xiamenensis]|uniref:LysR substrate-binding domain-containing protein n=1 Tax=Paracoccus xiamenensis TaxID=2714901 RepID=UPI00140AD387|nr:LysR substrate-binding domain-containing protein [Paracoccus xiamenensis]NHF72015.1 LysR family transcriptional regulator [Paracoccus xiamenensis]
MSEGDLGFFVLLAQRGSFVATARDMGVTASAVSRRLARLEDRLGVRLMNRTTRRVSLTGEGEAYFDKALRLLGEIEELEGSLRAGRDTPTGLLRVNATFGFSRLHIAPAISEFCTRYPGIDVQMVVTDAPMNIVEQGFDLNIRFGDPPSSNMVQRLLQRNRRFMCAAPAYLDRCGAPTSLQELGRHDCIVLRQEHDLYDVWRFDVPGKDSPSARVGGRLSTNDGDIAREWMLGGHGIMLRSEWDIARHVREGRLRVVLPDHFQTANIAAIYPERNHLAAKVRVFVDLLAERIRATNARDPMQLTEAQRYSQT